MRSNDRVVVDVEDAGLGVRALRDLVGVLRSGEPGPAVQELVNAQRASEVPGHPHQPVAVIPGHSLQLRSDLVDLLEHAPVDLVVVLAAEEAVIDTRDARLRRANRRRCHEIGLVVAGCRSVRSHIADATGQGMSRTARFPICRTPHAADVVGSACEPVVASCAESGLDPLVASMSVWTC
jgi:hypothetical protein